MKKIIYQTIMTIFFIIVLSGCVSYDIVPQSHYQTKRESVYPIGIISANFYPETDAKFLVEGKGEGALSGVGKGIGACASGGGGEGAALGFLVCLPVGMLIGGAVGASQAEESEKTAQIKSDLKKHLTSTQLQANLTNKVYRYFKQNSTHIPVTVLNNVTGPTSKEHNPSYDHSKLGKYASLLEMRLLNIKFKGSGNKGEPVCLTMSAKGRKIDVKTNKVVDELKYTQHLGCMTPSLWLENDGKQIIDSIKHGYQLLAENIVDELFLIYYPKNLTTSKKTSNKKVIPNFVLAPLYPAAPKQGIKLSSLFKAPKVEYTAWGGMYFRDVDSISPTLKWESFPRKIDYLANRKNRFSNVRYDLRIYQGRASKQFDKVQKSELVHKVRNLKKPFYKVKLDPCKWYYWTVRARFKLNGQWRATEWSGAYNTMGIQHTPSAYRRNQDNMFGIPSISAFYFPFRTPDKDGSRTCWQEVLDN